jgi:hypothetical protein
VESVAKVLAMVILAAALSRPHEEIVRSIPIDPAGRVFLRNSRGAVEVTRWDRAEVEIEARVRPGTLLGNGGGCVERTRVRVDSWPDSVRITAEFPAFEERVPWWLAVLARRCVQPPRIDYRLRLPREAALRVAPGL